MASGWKTKTVVCQGGTRLDIEPVMIDAVAPGALIDSQNVEASSEGGYKRIKGYAPYAASNPPGPGSILGAFVFNDGVVVARGSNVYFGTGGTWGSPINPTARNGAGTYRAAKYLWAENRITLVDGTNYPLRYNGTGNGTNLTASPLGASCIKEYKNRICLGVGGKLYISAPNEDNDYTSSNGGVTFNVGDTIRNFAIWRDNLYILCDSSVHRLTGDSISDFAVKPVSRELGCPYPDTVKEVAGDVIFHAADGIRTISATEKNSGDVNLSLDLLSRPIKPYTDEIGPGYASNVTAIIVPSKNQYRLFYHSGLVSATNSLGINMCFVEHEGGKGIEFYKLKGIQVTCGDAGRIASSNAELVIHGCENGGVFKQEYGDNFNGANISAFIKLPYYVFDDPAVRKTIYGLRAYIKVDDDALAYITAQINLDDNDAGVLQPPSIDLTTAIPPGAFIYGYSYFGTAIYGTGASVNYRTNPIGSGFNIGLTLSSNDTNPVWNVRTLIIEYAPDERE